jgi:hypothetical protein
MAACQSGPSQEQTAVPARMETSGIVDVTAIGLTFDAPDSIASGWNTFRFKNSGDMTHFALIERIPDDVGIAEHQSEVAPVFQQGMDLLNAGKPDSAFAAFGQLPEWFGEIVFIGGPGLTAKGNTSEAIVYLEPGNYLLECYVKTDGNFHSYNANPGKYGMVYQFTVTEDVSGAPAPTADVNITLSSERGIEVEGDLTPGAHTIAVYFEDQKAHENFVGHDVHLAQLEEDSDLGEIEAWMDWSQPTGLETPAPVEFLGGINEMPAGMTGYFTATLEPGEYAWIAEVPNTIEKGMLQRFSVRGETEPVTEPAD